LSIATQTPRTDIQPGKTRHPEQEESVILISVKSVILRESAAADESKDLRLLLSLLLRQLT
jgi:hypothetical protein